MKIENGFVSWNEKFKKFVVDMWDVESGDEVGWKSNERFEFKWKGKKYSGVVEDESGIYEVYFVKNVEVLS